eukprot:6178300-Heterocapsa_arctica.AAC.1
MDDVDGYHGGYPCGSFSRVRARVRAGFPGPVRDAQHIYGLPTNTDRQQAEANRGTLMCTRTLDMCIAVRASALSRGVPTVATGENPELPEDPLPSSFLLPECIKFMTDPNVHVACFPLCTFGSDYGKRM